MNGIIPNVYGKTTDNSLIDVIEKSRKDAQKYAYMPKWWICGECFCTQFNNGYYHAYVLEKSAYYGGVVLKDYRISRDGKMVDTDKYYSVPTRADLEKWCAERDIQLQ